MKFVIAQVFTIFVLNEVRSLDVSHGIGNAEHKKPFIPIVKYDSEQSNKGWKYSYESGNGIHAEEIGYIKNHGDEKHESVVQQGSITYHDEHGHPITLHYIADEHGFRPQGEHLPTSPPIPEDIQKSLEHEEGEQIEVTENQDDYEVKEQEQSQYYAESRVHAKTQSYQQPEPINGNRPGYKLGPNYGYQRSRQQILLKVH